MYDTNRHVDILCLCDCVMLVSFNSSLDHNISPHKSDLLDKFCFVIRHTYNYSTVER